MHATTMALPRATLLACLLLLLARSMCAAETAVRVCRMDASAANEFCGLPYELSNFQGCEKCSQSVLVGRPADRQQLAQLVKVRAGEGSECCV